MSRTASLPIHVECYGSQYKMRYSLAAFKDETIAKEFAFQRSENSPSITYCVIDYSVGWKRQVLKIKDGIAIPSLNKEKE